MAGYLRQVLQDPAALAARAAELFAIAASSAISERGVFYAAFSGGRTPLLFLEALASEPFRNSVQWEKVHVFFVDERCVPPDSEQSNFRLASSALLTRVRARVHRIEGELGPAEAANRYERELRATLGDRPALDMVLLGMGADGHTASLFPGSDALGEMERLAVGIADREPARVTLTLPVINASRSIVFHVTGADKAGMVREVLQGHAQSGKVGYVPPAALVDPRALWLLDTAAASGLSA